MPHSDCQGTAREHRVGSKGPALEYAAHRLQQWLEAALANQHTWWLKATQIYSHVVSDSRVRSGAPRLKLKCHRADSFWRPSRRIHSLPFLVPRGHVLSLTPSPFHQSQPLLIAPRWFWCSYLSLSLLRTLVITWGSPG